MTFPGTVASLRQMWGRAGRRGRGLAVYVAGEDALDQFFCRHPDEFLERPVEAAILYHENEPIHLAHLLCAAHEGPLDARPTPRSSGPRWQAYADLLVAAGRARRAPRAVPAAPARGLPGRARVAALGVARQLRRRRRRPAASCSARVEAARALSTVHDGAVYLHLGRSYEVRELDLDARRALVEPFDGDWYTQPKKETDT